MLQRRDRVSLLVLVEAAGGAVVRDVVVMWRVESWGCCCAGRLCSARSWRCSLMARSLARLSGRCRIASALGAGALAASLALAGCSSSSPKGGGTIPPLNTAGASSGSTAPASASGGASAGANSTASAGAVTAESLSDPTLGYTVVSIPQGLDATQTKVLQDFIEADKVTWRLWFTVSTDIDLTKIATGEALTNGMRRAENMRASGERLNPPIRVAVESVVADPGAINATVEVCEDQTQMVRVDAQGKDITKPEEKVNLPAAITMIPSSANKWVISREIDGEGDTCSISK